MKAKEDLALYLQAVRYAKIVDEPLVDCEWESTSKSVQLNFKVIIIFKKLELDVYWSFDVLPNFTNNMLVKLRPIGRYSCS